MTTFEQLDQQLAARGWYYDRGNERFMVGTTELSWNDVIGLLPVDDENSQYADCDQDDGQIV